MRTMIISKMVRFRTKNSTRDEEATLQGWSLSKEEQGGLSEPARSAKPLSPFPAYHCEVHFSATAVDRTTGTSRTCSRLEPNSTKSHPRAFPSCGRDAPMLSPTLCIVLSSRIYGQMHHSQLEVSLNAVCKASPDEVKIKEKNHRFEFSHSQ